MKKEDREKLKSNYDTPKILKFGSAAERENLNLPNDHIKESPCIASVAPVGVDVLPSPVKYSALPDNIMEQIENAIQDFCLYVARPPVDDLRKEKQLFFGAVCDYIGKKVNYKYVLPSVHDDNGRFASINVNVVIALLDAFGALCGTYNKIPSIYCFCKFCGFSNDWIFNVNGEYVSPERRMILQKARLLGFQGLKESIMDGTRNPTGAIAILNNEFWNVGVVADNTQSAVSSGSLPVLVENMETCDNGNA